MRLNSDERTVLKRKVLSRQDQTLTRLLTMKRRKRLDEVKTANNWANVTMSFYIVVLLHATSLNFSCKAPTTLFFALINMALARWLKRLTQPSHWRIYCCTTRQADQTRPLMLQSFEPVIAPSASEVNPGPKAYITIQNTTPPWC